MRGKCTFSRSGAGAVKTHNNMQTNAKPLMSSEAHSTTKRVGFNAMAIKSEHFQICVCPHPLKLMEYPKSWADAMSDKEESKGLSSSEDESNKPLKKRKIGKTTTKSHQITDYSISISIDEMVLVREVERELARSLSPTPGQTPKKVKKLQSVGDHGPSIAPGNFTRLSRSPYSHCQGAVQELFSSLIEETIKSAK